MPTITTDRIVKDGFLSLEGGIDSGRSAAVLDPNQVSFAINTTFRGGFAQCRPGWKPVELTFTPDQDTFEDGLFQGAAYYREDADNGSLLVQISGRLYRIGIEENGDGTSAVRDVTPSTVSTPDRPKAWFQQAEEFMIVQNGADRPIIYSGSASRRSVAGRKEVPVGTAMAYGMGRLWVALPWGGSFVAGDLVYGPSGTVDYRFRDALLKFTENEFLNEGGSFGIPLDAGAIRAMRFISTPDTSLGQGPLQVFTEKSVFSINAPVDRDIWKSLNYPIQTISLVGNGAMGHDSAVAVNGDIYFRSPEGVRSFITARRDFASPGNTPISKEMARVIKHDNLHHLEMGSAVVFDNRLLMTAGPAYEHGHGVKHQLLMVMDFDPLGSGSSKAPPVWEGVWRGQDILKLVTGRFGGVDRCFIFVLDEDLDIVLWEITKGENWDDTDQEIEWRIETKSYSFGDPFELKQLTTANLWLDEVRHYLTVDVDYRPDQYPAWKDWHEWNEFAEAFQCDPDTCVTELSPYNQQYRPHRRLPRPTEECESIGARPFDHGYEFQFKLTMTGFARVKKLIAYAHRVDEALVDGCAESYPGVRVTEAGITRITDSGAVRIVDR